MKKEGSEYLTTSVLLAVFFGILFLIAYVNFADLYLPSRGREGDFIFKNFLIYNFSLKLIFYPIKFFLITLLILTGSFILNIKSPKFIAIFKLTVIAEFVNLITDSFRIVWFALYPDKLTELSYDNFIQILSPHLSLAENPSILYSFMLNVSTYELVYVAILTYLTKELFEVTFFKSFIISGLMYFIASVLWTMVTVLLFI